MFNAYSKDSLHYFPQPKVIYHFAQRIYVCTCNRFDCFAGDSLSNQIILNKAGWFWRNFHRVLGPCVDHFCLGVSIWEITELFLSSMVGKRQEGKSKKEKEMRQNKKCWSALKSCGYFKIRVIFELSLDMKCVSVGNRRNGQRSIRKKEEAWLNVWGTVGDV